MKNLDELEGNTTTKYISCMCEDKCHLIVFEADQWPEEEYPWLSISYQLNHFLPWHKRIIHAFRYVFGLKNHERSWDSTLLTSKSVKDIQDILEVHYKHVNKHKANMSNGAT
jgi:hypothetical protein